MNLDRRKALKMLGLIAICFTGRWGEAAESRDQVLLPSYITEAENITFTEGRIKNIIIIRSKGEKIVIPFKEVVDALTSK